MLGYKLFSCAYALALALVEGYNEKEVRTNHENSLLLAFAYLVISFSRVLMHLLWS